MLISHQKERHQRGTQEICPDEDSPPVATVDIGTRRHGQKDRRNTDRYDEEAHRTIGEARAASNLVDTDKQAIVEQLSCYLACYLCTPELYETGISEYVTIH